MKVYADQRGNLRVLSNYSLPNSEFTEELVVSAATHYTGCPDWGWLRVFPLIGE